MRLYGTSRLSLRHIPFPEPTEKQADDARDSVNRLVEVVRSHQDSTRQILDWLRIEHGIEAPSSKLRSSLELDSESFVNEARRLRGKNGPLSLAALRSLRTEHNATIIPAQALEKEALGLERKISELVNDAYKLNSEDVHLIWDTSPPRMPISRL